MTRIARERAGRRAERLAEIFLRLKGWRVLARRVRTARGEIDLVCRHGTTLAFVEVKWRAKRRALDHAIDEYRLRRVASAAQSVAHRFGKAGDDYRIDVILLAPWSLPRHIVNAWQP